MASAAFAEWEAELVNVAPPPAGYSTARRAIHSVVLFARLARAIARHRPAAVYLMSGSGLGFYEKALMGLLCRACGAGTVIHLIGGGFRDFVESGRVHRVLVPWFLERTTLVACVGAGWIEFVGAIAPEARARFLPNPVDASAFLPPPGSRVRSRDDADIRFLYVGLMEEVKGPLDLVDACALAQAELRGRARVTMVGGGSLLETVRQRIRDRGVSDFVEAPGYVPEPDKVRRLAEADVFVLPSHAEGFPVAVLEAMSAGLPVIACAVGAVPEAVSARTGMVVPPHAPTLLADALRQMIGLGEARIEMGRRGREIVLATYDIRTVGPILGRLWEEAARLRHTGRGGVA